MRAASLRGIMRAMRLAPHPPARRHTLPRRELLRGGLAGLFLAMSKPSLVGCSSDAEKTKPLTITPPKLASDIAAIGDLGPADANGVRLPPGFSSRIVARSGEAVLPGGHEWHGFPDGGACFATPDGGWIYVSNSEMPFVGGVGALRFDAKGELVDAYPILENTNVNCAGGPTPWGTWLSCEEVPAGKVYECDPFGKKPAVERLALGVFKHEAVTVDPQAHKLYLTEDDPDGRFYRFTPDKVSGGVPDLSAGTLEVAEVTAAGAVIWHPLPDPQFSQGIPTQEQVAQSTVFKGGEGIWWFDGVVYFSTKGDDRVWAYHAASQELSVLYDVKTSQNPILSGVDNITVSCCGDVLVAEDGGDMQIVAILPDASLKPLLQIEGQDSSEITGPAFDPSGTRLYFSSQRGSNGSGITFEVTGPFHHAVD